MNKIYVDSKILPIAANLENRKITNIEYLEPINDMEQCMVSSYGKKAYSQEINEEDFRVNHYFIKNNNTLLSINKVNLSSQTIGYQYKFETFSPYGDAMIHSLHSDACKPSYNDASLEKVFDERFCYKEYTIIYKNNTKMAIDQRLLIDVNTPEMSLEEFMFIVNQVRSQDKEDKIHAKIK